MKKKRMFDNFIKNQKVIIFILVIVVISFMTVGFALYGEVLQFGGNVSLQPDGKLNINNITLVSSSNVSSSSDPIFTGTSVEFNIIFAKSEDGTDEFYAIYSADIVNESSYEYVYDAFSFQPVVNSSGGEGTLSLDVSGIKNGDIIKTGETRTITMKLSLEVTDTSKEYTATGTTDISVESNKKGSILASVTPLDVDLTGGNETAELSIEVINTYSTDINFSIRSSNSNFELVDASGNDLGSLKIAANSTDNYKVYLKIVSGSSFYDSNEETTLSLNSDEVGTVYMDKIAVTVDASSEVETSIPEIGDISFTINNTVGSANLSWSRLDNGLSITSYTILLYNSEDTLVDTINTNSDITSYTLTDLEEGSYYVKIYGTDKAGSNGSEYVDSATLDSVYCRKSDTVALKWVFSVTSNFTGLTFTGADTVNLGNTYSATISASMILFQLPTSIKVSMGGVDLDASRYEYDSETGSFTIENVTGDLILSGTGSTSGCLVKGTKIRLANGKYKNIEDIRYDDLLSVWSYEEGRFVNQYPIWIEETKLSSKYLLVKFSNGNELKIVKDHGIYNMDLNMFVSVNDSENFKIGTNVAVLNNHGTGFTNTKVVDIKYVDDVVTYYHVVSTRYYNIIANDILTTDDAVVLSNLYGFDDDIKWPSVRKLVMSDNNNLYNYNEFENVLPYYMFKGLRAEEGKFLANLGYLPKEVFINYLMDNQVNPSLWLEPSVNMNGKRMWMVSTSNNRLNNYKGELVIEGDYYKLGLPNKLDGFLYWYDTASSKKYNVGDFVQIWYGTHFEAIYK